VLAAGPNVPAQILRQKFARIGFIIHDENECAVKSWTRENLSGLNLCRGMDSAFAGASATLVANSPAAQSPPSKDMREEMATLHEQMTACSRSNKSITQCHAEMMKSCQDVVGKYGCPMMGIGSRMHHHMMQPAPANSGDQK
jgi:hypothetical protein